MNEKEITLYNKAIGRLRRQRLYDPLHQIAALEEEIDRYRETIENQRRQLATMERLEHLRNHRPHHRPTGLEKPYIELRPTCSECGAIQENVACGYEKVEHPNITDYEVRITPAHCKNCGAVFGYVVFQGDPPEEPKAPPAYMDDRTESGLLEDD